MYQKYLLPRLVSVLIIEAEESQVGFVPFKKSFMCGHARGSRGGGGRGRGEKTKSDPLRKIRFCHDSVVSHESGVAL